MNALMKAAGRGRNVEALLLVIALAIGLGANAVVAVDRQQSLPGDFWTQGAILAVLAAGFHVVLRLRAPHTDQLILPIVVALNGLGIAVIQSLDQATGSDAGANQLRWTAVSMVIAAVVLWFLRDHRRLARYTYTALALSAVLLLLPLVPGISAGDINGASVWIRLGPMTFQPGEIAKITLAVFFAGYLSMNRTPRRTALNHLLSSFFPVLTPATRLRSPTKSMKCSLKPWKQCVGA